MKAQSDALTDKIGIGLADLTEALGKIEANETLTAVTMIVTTRQLGFSAAFIYTQANLYPEPDFCNIYSFYRVNLLLFERRMTEVMANFSKSLRHPEELYEFHMTYNRVDAVKHVTEIPGPVKIYLDACGPVTENENIYVPGLCRNQILGGRRRRHAPMAEQITLSNLRATVRSLANEEVNQDVRRQFYRHSPLPGARWAGAPDDPILQNPDDFMQANYTNEMIHADIQAYNRMMAWLVLYAPKIIDSSPLDFAAKGNRAIFVCNAQEDLRMPDLAEGEALEDYYRRLRVEGTIQTYWSQYGLQKIEQMHGQLNLMGEIVPIVMLRSTFAS